METRAKTKARQASIFEELRGFAADASTSTLRPSDVAYARRRSGLVLKKEATRVAPKRWPTVYTLKEKEDERRKNCYGKRGRQHSPTVPVETVTCKRGC
jgi:hypothetical protein